MGVREYPDLPRELNGNISYCISRHNIIDEKLNQELMIMGKLAYQYFDWASREIVAYNNRKKHRLLQNQLSLPKDKFVI
jgi:hypothetical protein